jgi:predicted transcriptional regulator
VAARSLRVAESFMTKLLEQAIAKVRELPDEEQDTLAAIILSMADADASRFPLDGATEAAIREGLAQAERGELVPDEVVAGQQTPRRMKVR